MIFLFVFETERKERTNKIEQMNTCPICGYGSNNLETLYEHVDECLKGSATCNDTINILTDVQRKAMDLSNRRAEIFGQGVTYNLLQKLTSFGLSSAKPEDDLVLLQKYFDEKVRFTINLRIEVVLDFFLKDGFYRNVFEVQSVSKNVKDVPGYYSGRKTWEDNLFNNVYRNAKPCDRVKYGAVNLTCCKTGSPANSYGESFLTLRREVHDRISFCVGDSANQEMHIATFKHPLIALNLIDPILLKEVLEIAKHGKYNGITNYFTYLEGQIHGPVSLKRDIESLHVPEQYKKNTAIMKKLGEFVELYCVPVIFF